MRNLRNYPLREIICFALFFLIFFCFTFNLSATEIKWLEVSKTKNKSIFIDPDSINYKDKGYLTVQTKYSEFDSIDRRIIDSDYFLMAIDCENRLFKKLPLYGELKHVKNWKNPINDKLIKITILNSCSY